jgi:PleD family two-component response regulator
MSQKFNDHDIEQELKSLRSDPSIKSYEHPILIIDDDKWMQKIFERYLSSWGFHPISACDAYKGIAMAIKYRPMIIFLDYLMPEVNGESLLKMLKEIELTSCIPIVIISADLNMNLLNKTYEIGASDFISKPFSQQILFDKIRNNISPLIFGSTNIDELKLSTELFDEVSTEE